MGSFSFPTSSTRRVAGVWDTLLPLSPLTWLLEESLGLRNVL